MLLQMEHDFEKKEYEAQLLKTSVQWKVRHGVCWFPVRHGTSFYNSVNQLVMEFHKARQNEARTGEEDPDEEESRLEWGKPVVFFTLADEKIKLLGTTGVVSYVDGDRTGIVVPHPGDLATLAASDNLGIQLYFDESGYQLMFSALQGLLKAKNERLAVLRDILLGGQPAAFRTARPMSFPWLNPSQEAAVNMVLNAKDVAIVHGPPGTGKTTTLVEAICETLNRETQILVCAQSNMAVDWISEQLAQRGVNVLRIGNPTRVSDAMLASTYERRFEAHPLYSELWGIRKAIRQLQANRNKEKAVHDRMVRLKDRATDLEIKIRQEIFDQCRIVATTLAGSANKALYGIRFQSLFIDEAAQAMEAACWVAISKADRVIFAGDHCQLPPTIMCAEAARLGLDETLMEKVVKNKPECVKMLDTQYRMNEQIARFPSDYFYHGKLMSAPNVRSRGILDLDNPMLWLDTSELGFREESTADSAGRFNSMEARFTVKKLEEYVERIGKQRIESERIDFGLISPYRHQVYRLRRLVAHSTALRSVRKHITVNTIDGFQGQERDVIIISLVRQNADGQIGFLRELRRMNVAITRARMKLIIVGAASTLVKHRFYKMLRDYTTRYGTVETCEAEENNRPDQ